MPTRLAMLLAVAIAFASVVAPADAVTLGGAKRQLRKLLIGRYGKPMDVGGCRYRGSRNRVDCYFVHNSTDVSACGSARIAYHYSGPGFRRAWRTFNVDEPCGE